MSRTILIAAMVLVLVGDAEAARWRWPWGHPTPRRHHIPRKPVQPSPPLDCDQIRRAVNALSPDDLTRELTKRTKKQQQIIKDCVGR